MLVAELIQFGSRVSHSVPRHDHVLRHEIGIMPPDRDTLNGRPEVPFDLSFTLQSPAFFFTATHRAIFS
jgi:hypothetical protein